jgi:hypothetical protein
LLKRTNPPEAARDRLSSEGSQETEAVRRTRELRDALKQLTTTAEILEVIRNSLDDTQLESTPSCLMCHGSFNSAPTR